MPSNLPPHPTIGVGLPVEYLGRFYSTSVTTMKDLGWGSGVLRKESRRGSVSVEELVSAGWWRDEMGWEREREREMQRQDQNREKG